MRRTGYDELHEMFRDTVRMFIEREVAPHYDKWERDGIVPKELFRKAGDAGILGFSVPEEYGGGGARDFRYTAVFLEEFCKAGVYNATGGFILQMNVALPYFLDFANEEQRRKWLPGIASGDIVAALGMSEPGAGSDAGAISTTARRDGDEYVINGSKQFISNGEHCDVAIVVARTGDPSMTHHNLSLIVVEADREGFEKGPQLEKIGMHCADTTELFFTDVRVPVTNRLGDENKAFEYLVSTLPQERLTVAITAVAHADAAFGWTLQYSKERHAFGQPIGSFQNSRFALATMRTELDIAQVFVDRQMEALLAGELTAEEAAEAKWWCTDLNKRVLDQCLQLHGGYGYMEEYPIARAWRDGRAMSIYAGTNEIMKDIIGRRVLGV